MEIGLIKDYSWLRKKDEPEWLGKLEWNRQNLVKMGLIKYCSLTGLKRRSEMGEGSVLKAPRDGMLTDAGLVEALRRAQELAQRGEALLEMVLENLA